MPSAVSDADLAALAARLDGTVVINHDTEKPATPPIWNGLLQGPTPVFRTPVPRCYVHARSKRDVTTAVDFAMRHGMKVSARGSGHQYGGLCLVDGGMVLDLSALNSIHVDPAARTAIVEPGVRTSELRAATIQHGLHFPGGHISPVGIAGFILGGGNGWGQTRWGAAADNVDSFLVVLLDGHAQEQQQQQLAGQQAGREQQQQHADQQPCCRVVEVDATNHSDLFRGLKGGGFFLAIVLEFRVRLHPVPPSLPCLTAIYPLSCLHKVGEFYQAFHGTNPPAVEAAMSVLHLPPPPPPPPSGPDDPSPPQPGGTGAAQAVVIIGCHAFPDPKGPDGQGGAPEPSIEAAYAKLRSFLPEQRLQLSEGPVPYLEALAALDGAWEWARLCLYGHGMFMHTAALTPEVLQLLQGAAQSMTSERSLILVCPSAATAAAKDIAAVSFRDCLFVSLYAMWERTEAGPEADGDSAHVQWVRHVREALKPHVVGLYVNEVMHDQEGQAQQCYSQEAYELLWELKRRHDPHGLLRAL